MKKVIIVLGQLSCVAFASAQNSMRVEIQTSNIFSASFDIGRPHAVPLKAIGTSIQYQLFRSVGIKANYQQWIDLFSSTVTSDKAILTIADKAPHSKLMNRANYKMMEISAIYRYPLKRHEINADFGPSYTWGDNFVITHIFRYPGYPDTQFEGETRHEKYLGIKYELGYNYLLFQNRVNVGLSVSSRNYFGKYAFTQYNLNVNFGYNFNLMKRKQTSKD